MEREKRSKKLNLKTLEYDTKEKNIKYNSKKNKKNIKNLNEFKNIFVLLLIVLIGILLIFMIYFKNKSAKFVVKDFLRLANEDIKNAKEKYGERQDFFRDVENILSSRFKYEILEIKDVKSNNIKNNQEKIVEAKIKIYNIDKRKAKTEADSKTSNELKIGSEKYNNEYLKNLKEVVKKAELQNFETTIKLKKNNGKWYITNIGNVKLDI